MNNSQSNQTRAADLLTKEKRIRFPSGSYQAFYEGISYKIDPENDIVEMTQRLNPRYSPESREEAVNLANKLGIEKFKTGPDYSQNSFFFQYCYSYF